MEELVENFKSIINSPPESNNSNSSISTITTSGKIPELTMDSDKIYSSSPQTIELTNTRIELELIDIYFKYHHPALPFLWEPRVRSTINNQDLGDQTLISAICTIALKIHNYLKRLPLLEIDDNPYYQRTRRLLAKEKKPSLSVLQAMLLLEFMEMGHSRPFRAFCISAEAIKMGQILGLHNLNVLKSPSELTEAEIEPIKCWVHCLSLDMLTSLFYSKPTHTRNNQSPLENRFIRNLGETYRYNTPSRYEKEYIYIHFFHHMVKVKRSTFFVNSVLQSGSYNTKEVYMNLIQLIESMKLDVFDLLYDSKIVLTLEDCKQMDDYAFISNLTLASFKASFNLLANYLVYKVSELGDDADVLLSMEHYLKARSGSIELYSLLSRSEERYVAIVGKELGKVIYGTHFCYCLGLEVAMLCHQDDPTLASKKFINLCLLKQQEFSVFWPLIKNPLTKNQMMRLHIPSSIVPPTPDYHT
ncbi:hypothetical protein K502DRAFT_361091 [Neoconidiobolus thromboides FSU 785]|nr:hypothetical protein K502DRAFT_361091 [Neoconidiobolus thromboides FSU 785]